MLISGSIPNLPGQIFGQFTPPKSYGDWFPNPLPCHSYVDDELDRYDAEKRQAMVAEQFKVAEKRFEALVCWQPTASHFSVARCCPR